MPSLRRAAREPELLIHPDDAAPRGIAAGARVRIHNDRGAFGAAGRTVVIEALRSLEKIGDLSVGPEVVPSLASPNAGVRAAAAHAARAARGANHPMKSGCYYPRDQAVKPTSGG